MPGSADLDDSGFANSFTRLTPVLPESEALFGRRLEHGVVELPMDKECNANANGVSKRKGGKAMSKTSAVVAIYETHAQAEEAVKELQRFGLDVRKMSIVGKDYHTDEHVPY